MASAIFDSVASAIADAAAVTCNAFTWKGTEYACVLSQESSSLVVSKTLFANSIYPKQGNVITVAGKDRQVVSIANATMEFAPGGLIDTGRPFTDDPNNPALAIGFASFING